MALKKESDLPTELLISLAVNKLIKKPGYSLNYVFFNIRII